MREKRPIKVYIRVRPFNDEEKEREEASALEIYKEESRIKVLDERHSLETSYFFDGVFSAEDNNEKVYLQTAKPLINKLLNGINCALLTYGQTGTGKTHTVLAEGSVTSFTINHLFEKISQDVAHKYKVTCSFVQVYQDKVYDMLSQDCKDELCLREHPKKGIYVANLSYHVVNSAKDALNYLSEGRKELIIAETRMVRHSSRSHAIFQLCIERRLDPNRRKCESLYTIKDDESAPSSASDMNNSFEYEDDVNPLTLEEDIILRGKIDICDLAGSERLGKTMAEGVRLSEAKHINSSLLELGNVIYALSEGTKRHIPFRNSTLTRLLQVCLGPQCRTSFIVCVAPTSSEAYETRCSLNFGTRARKITNKERLILNVEVDYKILSRRLAKRIELLESQLERDGSELVSLKTTEIEAPITVETQTNGSVMELRTNTYTASYVEKEANEIYSIPKLEVVIISELMKILFIESSTQKTTTLQSLLIRVASLLHQFICVVLSRKQHLTPNETTWTELDLEQVLRESLDDLDLMTEANMADEETSFQANDVEKYTEYVCRRIEERCSKTEEDLNLCLERYRGILLFTEDEEEMDIYRRIKKLIEFLENNKEAELPMVTAQDDTCVDVSFLSWMVNVHMALRLTLLVLHITKSNDNTKTDPCGTPDESLIERGQFNETFGSISAIDEESTVEEVQRGIVSFKSFASLGEHFITDHYNTASTPKRGLPVPFSLQRQFYEAKHDLPSFDLESSFDISNFKQASYLDKNTWLPKEQLNGNFMSKVELESMDDTVHDIEVSHQHRLKQRRLKNSNAVKLEEKCELLEDKNSKLIRTLNVIMRENKDLNEKLRVWSTEKARPSRDFEENRRKLERVLAENSSLERNLDSLQMERKRWETEALKLNTDNHQIRIEMHALNRQIAVKETENDSLREQITDLQTELSVANADREFLDKQLEERVARSECDGKLIEDTVLEKEKILADLKAICSGLEDADDDVNDNQALSGRKRSKSCNLSANDTTFETELFVAIENNIRIESIVNEVKAKLTALTCPDMSGKKGARGNVGKEGVKFTPPKMGNKPQGARVVGKRGTNGETKASALRRSKSLKERNSRTAVEKTGDKDSAVGTQVKGTKIKELMNEKLKIEGSYKELLKKHDKVEEDLKTAKTQIEMLVNECGALDHELGKFKKGRKAYEGAASTGGAADDCSAEVDESLFLRTKEIENLGNKHQELKKICEDYESKLRQLEHDLETRQGDYIEMKHHARDMERKNDNLACELQHYKTQSYSQKIECSRLKEHLIELGQELNREQQKAGQLSGKLAAVKEKYNAQIARVEAELVKCAKKLDRYREREKERRQEAKRKESSSVTDADSGLMQDQSEDYLDLT